MTLGQLVAVNPDVPFKRSLEIEYLTRPSDACLLLLTGPKVNPYAVKVAEDFACDDLGDK